MLTNPSDSLDNVYRQSVRFYLHRRESEIQRKIEIQNKSDLNTTREEEAVSIPAPLKTAFEEV